MLLHRPICHAHLLSLAALLLLGHSFADEYKTEPSTVAEARQAGWEVIRGSLSKLQAPQLSVASDAAVGDTALRVEVAHPGQWQGIQLNDTIDLSGFAGLELYIKQNVRTSGSEWSCVVQVFFEGGGSAQADAGMGMGEWTRAYLPFRSPPWTLRDRPDGWGKTTRIRLYPYRELDTPGEFLMIDGMRLVPRSEDPLAETQGIAYAYQTPPDGGVDAECALLLDGEVAQERQAVWAAYGADPQIVFDLGEEQTLTRAVLKAYAIPAQNIATATIEMSGDGENWSQVASIVNESSSQALGEQTLAATCVGVGRYLRITLKRPRVDVPLALGEVALQRRVTTQADREARSGPYFDGPNMPPIAADLTADGEYAVLRGNRIVVAIHRKTGIVGGLWNRGGARVLLRGWDRYIFENRDELVQSSEYADEARELEIEDGTLALTAENADMPGLTLLKEYRLGANEREEWLEKTTSFRYGGPRDDQFATLLTNCAVDEAYRRGAYYETAQVRCARILADKIRALHVVPACKAVMLVRPASLETVTQYRHGVNGRFCFPNHGQNPMEAYNRTSYNRCGWEIGHATLKLSGEDMASTRVHTALLDGGRFGWERHYVSLPDYRSYMAGLERPEWLRDLRTMVLDTYRCVLWGQAERTARRLSRVFNGTTLTPGLTHLDGVWGELPVAGDAIGLFGGVTPTDDIARMFRQFVGMPRYRAGLYMWLTSVNPQADVFRQHPDWFTVANKDGDPRVVFPQLKTNFGRIMSIPEHQEFVAEQVLAIHRRYPQDVWYLDGGNTAVNLIDWQSLRTTQDYHGEDFCRRLREQLKRDNPELVVFFNSADDRLADIGYAEIGREFGKEWRRAAARMYSCKVRQFFDPERLMSPLYWVGPGNNYLRICTALGFPPSGPPGLETADLLAYAPYCQAAFETRVLQFSPTAYAPDWRFDEDTALEMYALRAGRGLVLSAVSHRDADHSYRLSAQVPQDVASPGETVYLVHHTLKDIDAFSLPNSDFANQAAYRQTHWATGAVTQMRDIRPVGVDETGGVAFEARLTPGLLNVFCLVREPVFFFSHGDLRANFLLPQVQGRSSSAQPGAEGLTVTVTPGEKPCELLALAPPGMKLQQSSTGGAQVRLFGLNGRIMNLSPASAATRLSLRFVPAKETQGALRLSMPDSVRAGEALVVQVDGALGPLRCSIWREGTLILAADAPGPSIRLTVPVQVHDGSHEIEVTSADGHRGSAAFQIVGHQSTDDIAPNTPPLQHGRTVNPIDAPRDGATILSSATTEYGRCTPAVDPDALTLRAEVPRECVSYYAQSMAGIELSGARSLAVRLDHNMYPVRGLYPERHVLYEKHANAFIGLFVDYGSAEGYLNRVALSAGEMSRQRTSKCPDWGAAKPPDRYLQLPPTIYTGQEVAGRLDLAKWAPEAWDGRVWVSAVMDLALPNRWLTLRITALNPEPGALPELTVQDPEARAGLLKRRSIEVVRFQTPPKLDGKLDDAVWQSAPPERGLLVLASEGQRESQETEIRMGCDAGFLYIGVTAWEREKKGFDTTNGAAGRPWWDDGVELALAPPQWKGEFLHQIVTADAVTFQEISTHMHDKQRKSSVPVVCRVAKQEGRFTIEVAVPVGDGGLPSPKVGSSWRAQFMRTRVLPSGLREHATWTPVESLYDLESFGSILFR